MGSEKTKRRKCQAVLQGTRCNAGHRAYAVTGRRDRADGERSGGDREVGSPGARVLTGRKARWQHEGGGGGAHWATQIHAVLFVAVARRDEELDPVISGGHEGVLAERLALSRWAGISDEWGGEMSQHRYRCW